MNRFYLRRAVERLRDGLFDRTAMDFLTVKENRIENIYVKDLKAIEEGKSNYLCICGSYGQGKSHTLNYLNQLALSQGYATSVVHIDLREVPFCQFSIVYQAIMRRLSLPDSKKFTNVWKNWADKDSLKFLDSMPHRFKMILTAMLHKNKQLTSREVSLKKYQAYKPKEYGSLLDKALIGHDIATTHIRNICKYREVDGYKEQSLICRENDSYFQMIQSLGIVLNKMGYKGLLLFFDEMESIAQGRLGQRVKSYNLLDRFFQTKGFVFPVFAFTDDFFDKVKNELYDGDKKVFPKNYSEVWQDVTILRLQNFSCQGWEFLLDRLLQLYSLAYQIDISLQVKQSLKSLLNELAVHETRFKIKALVNKLDIETQKILLDI